MTTELGLNYLLGRNTLADPDRGIRLIEQAARDGDARAAYLAATISGTCFWRPRNWDLALDFLMEAARLDYGPAQSSLKILAGGIEGKAAEGDDWSAMRRSIDLSTWLGQPQIDMLREAPRMYKMEKFIPAMVCDWLIMQARDQLSRATIYDKVTGGTTEDGRRTNSQCDLDIETGGLVTFVIRARITAVTGRQDLAMEIPKILHYAPGETFADHFDYLNPEEPAFADQLAVRGQRTDTFLIYLNDDYSGGETHFPRIDLTHAGAKGDALLFKNVDINGVPDQDTMHTGRPPTSGEKWLFSQWIREYPK